MMMPYPSKLYFIHMLTELYEHVTDTENKRSCSTNFTPRRKEWKQTVAHKWHPSTLVRSVPILPFNLLRLGFHHVPSHCFLATHAKYFFTLRTKLSFFTLLLCPLTVTKVTLMYIPGNRRTIFWNSFPFKYYSCWVAVALYLIRASTYNVGMHTAHSLTGSAVTESKLVFNCLETFVFLIQVLLYSYYSPSKWVCLEFCIQFHRHEVLVCCLVGFWSFF